MTDNRIVDIHTHILPEIDDGSQSVEESIRLLLAEKRQGVTDVVFTPHFVLQEESLSDFVSKRDAAFDLLERAVRENPAFDNMRFYKGAEVRFDPYLGETDLDKLCFEGTSYMLLEPLFSIPFNFEQTVYTLMSKGIVPIIAHVERFDYLVSDKKFLQQLKNDGVIFQCNVGALKNKIYAKNLKKLLKTGFIHVLASDTHNLEKRPPNLGVGLEKLKKYSEDFKLNAQKIITNQLI